MKIEEILENKIVVSLNDARSYNELMNHYLLFRDTKMYVGEIEKESGNQIVARLIGEIINNDFSFGVSTKPSFKATVDLISKNSSSLIISYPDSLNSLYLGHSSIF